MRIAVIGLRYVGLVSAACFAEIGHQIISVVHRDGASSSGRNSSWIGVSPHWSAAIFDASLSD
jgi:glycine/D-amino acid oxidase-like deaminating enzyme